MSKLKRWIDDSPPEAVLALLQSARGERAPSRVLSRTLIALGTTSAASVATTVAAASGSVATASKLAPSLAAIVIKWGGAGLLGGSVVAGAMAVGSRMSSSRAEHAPAESTVRTASVAANPSPDLPRVGVGMATTTSTTSVSTPMLEPPKPSAPVGKQAEASALATESTLIGTAHARLRAGDGTLVLELLKGYEERFAPPHFEPEVLYLRMQSLRLRGDQVGARRLARDIAQRFPTSPGMSHAEALLHSDGGVLEK